MDRIGFDGLILEQGSKGAFKYGIDAVLLADYASRTGASHIIDLGSGNGILPLILARKTEAEILGVEIQTELFELANRNARMNGLSDKVQFMNMDIMDLKLDQRFDCVVTNPPYFAKASAIKNISNYKMIARHEITATVEDFIRIAAEILIPKGELYMIHRPSRLVDIFYFARSYKMEPKRIKFVAPRKNKKPNLVLIQFIKGGGVELKIEEDLFVYGEDGYTEDIRRIYLNK